MIFYLILPVIPVETKVLPVTFDARVVAVVVNSSPVIVPISEGLGVGVAGVGVAGIVVLVVPLTSHKPVTELATLPNAEQEVAGAPMVQMGMLVAIEPVY